MQTCGADFAGQAKGEPQRAGRESSTIEPCVGRAKLPSGNVVASINNANGATRSFEVTYKSPNLGVGNLRPGAQKGELFATRAGEPAPVVPILDVPNRRAAVAHHFLLGSTHLFQILFHGEALKLEIRVVGPGPHLSILSHPLVGAEPHGIPSVVPQFEGSAQRAHIGERRKLSPFALAVTTSAFPCTFSVAELEHRASQRSPWATLSFIRPGWGGPARVDLDSCACGRTQRGRRTGRHANRCTTSAGAWRRCAADC